MPAGGNSPTCLIAIRANTNRRVEERTESERPRLARSDAKPHHSCSASTARRRLAKPDSVALPTGICLLDREVDRG